MNEYGLGSAGPHGLPENGAMAFADHPTADNKSLIGFIPKEVRRRGGDLSAAAAT